MGHTFGAFWVATGAVLACALGSSQAAAYCQTTTSEQQVSGCANYCVAAGYPLAWPASEITYVFNEKGFPGIPKVKLHEIFTQAFGAWEAVTCDGRPVGLQLKPASYTTQLTVGPKKDEPNDSVISHLTAEEWADLGNSPQAFALTAIWFDANSGRILGADMHFNGGMDPFGVCPDEGCSLNDHLTDLPNVATHESGHFLGLAHSQVEISTMYCSAQAFETDKRSLDIDDEKGLCAAYPPGVAFTDAYFPASSGKKSVTRSTCAATSTRAGSFTSLTAAFLLAMGLFARRRRSGAWLRFRSRAQQGREW